MTLVGGWRSLPGDRHSRSFQSSQSAVGCARPSLTAFYLTSSPVNLSHLRRQPHPPARHRQRRPGFFLSSQEQLKQRRIQPLAPRQPHAPLPQKPKPERRPRLRLRQKLRREIQVRLRHRHQNQRPPAHPQQVLQHRDRRPATPPSAPPPARQIAAAGSPAHPGTPLAAPPSKTASTDPRAHVFLDVLQIVAQLQQHAPRKREPALRLGQLRLRPGTHPPAPTFHPSCSSAAAAPPRSTHRATAAGSPPARDGSPAGSRRPADTSPADTVPRSAPPAPTPPAPGAHGRNARSPRSRSRNRPLAASFSSRRQIHPVQMVVAVGIQQAVPQNRPASAGPARPAAAAARMPSTHCGTPAQFRPSPGPDRIPAPTAPVASPPAENRPSADRSRPRPAPAPPPKTGQRPL